MTEKVNKQPWIQSEYLLKMNKYRIIVNQHNQNI